MSIIIIFTAFILLFLFYNYYWKRRDFPSGPPPLPLVGNIASMMSKKRAEYQFVEWKEKYGSIYTYWLGGTPIVSINDVKLANQMFVKDSENYVDRGGKMSFQSMMGEKTLDGIFFTDGQLWQDQRRFTLKFLRDFGLGKNQMQDRILEEVHVAIDNINKGIDSGLEEHNLFDYTDIAVGSIVNSLVFGYRFTEGNNEQEFYKLKALTAKLLESVANPIVIFGFFNEWLGSFIKKLFPKYYRPLHEIFEFIDGQIEKRIKSEEIDEDMEPRDLVDAFLIEKARQKRLNLPTADLYTLQQLRGVAFDIWFGGQESTSNSLLWAVAFMIVYPQVQEKLHEELDRVIGSDRIVTVSDRPQLTYFSAFIMELLRCANVVAQNAPRMVSQDVEVDGVKIKKGSYCLAQVSVFHYNPKIFPNPDLFKPERFLDQNGKLVQNDALLPFSLGKRFCPGEGLARMEIFLFLANLCNQYKFSSGKQEPVLEKINPTATSMIPYKCVIKKRFT